MNLTMDANAVSTAQREKKGLLCSSLSSPSLALSRVIPVIHQKTTGARHHMPLWSLLVCRAQTPQWTSKSGMESGVESAAKEGKSSRCPGWGQGCPGGLCRAILCTAMTWGHTSVSHVFLESLETRVGLMPDVAGSSGDVLRKPQKDNLNT